MGMVNKYAVIKNGVVINIVLAEEAIEKDWVLASDLVGIGYTYNNGVFSEPVVTVDPETIRKERNRLLAESDWTQLSDSPVNKSAWATYRQELRDLPEQVGFPNYVVWPTLPG